MTARKGTEKYVTGQKKKRKKEIRVDDRADEVTSDPRFSAILTDSAFAIDPSSSNFKVFFSSLSETHFQGSKLLEKQVKAKSVGRNTQKVDDAARLVDKLKAKTKKWKK